MKHWDFTEIKPVAFASGLSNTLATSAGDLASGGIILQSVQRLLNENRSVSILPWQTAIHSAQCQVFEPSAGRRRLKWGPANEAGKSITEAGKHQHMHRPAHGLREVVWINFLLGGVTAV